MLSHPQNLIYDAPLIHTPLKKNIKIIFADDTASGRPSPIVDKQIRKYILPYYANTHSNSLTGILMKKYICLTKKFIRKYFNLHPDHCVIFSGNGATGAINHIANSIDLSKHKSINIILSMYEHHSNYLPWVEMQTTSSNIQIKILPITPTGTIQLDLLDGMIDKQPDVMNIVSLTACSNVTGTITNQNHVIRTIRCYPNVLIMFDYASYAPYHQLDLSDVDCAFISGHKYVGGTGSPGLLIAKKCLFERAKPFCPGGGCVVRADTHKIQYNMDPEIKESAGTPNIIGIIRFYYAVRLQQKLLPIISNNHQYMIPYIDSVMQKLCANYSNLIMLSYLGEPNRHPTYSFAIKNLHYNLVVVLFNDLYAIQVRGGISCCGNFGEQIKDMYGVDGWVRITFSWKMSMDQINHILEALETILREGKSYEKKYDYSKEANLWKYKKLR